MSLGVARLAAKQGSLTEEALVAMEATDRDDGCIPQYVPSVALRRKYLSSHETADQCIVAIAITRSDQVTDSNLV